VDESVLGAVRVFRKRDGNVWVQYADHEKICDFTESSVSLELMNEREHFFGTVPVNFYRNNSGMTGDFEPVLTLVDAYNTLQSECVNDFELFADSYLAISGMGGTTAQDMEKLRRERVLLLDEGGDAKWLTKTVNDQYIENLKTRIAKDIYRFSGTADIAEAEGVGSLASGIAMKYRLVNFENRVAVTEQFFRRGLMHRFDIIASLYTAMGRQLDVRGLKVTFTRNLPGNWEAAADLAVKLDGIVSRKTLLELLPFVDSTDAETARMEDEA
jgi:SPP1 family phage portal protein